MRENQTFNPKTDIYNKGLMDYKLVYSRLVERAYNRKLPKEQYTEKHHVMPICLGGPDTSSNLVELTAREHFICHWLLHRLYPDHAGLAHAFWGLCNWKSGAQPRYVPSSRAYAEAKKGRANAMQTKVYIYNLDGTYVTDFQSQLEAADFIGVTPSSLNSALKKQHKTGNYQVRYSKVNKIGTYQKATTAREVYVWDLTGRQLYKCSSLKEAAEKTGVLQGNVSGVLGGRNKQCKGYWFSYTDNFTYTPATLDRTGPIGYKFVNTETGEIYESQRAAERALGKSRHTKGFKAMVTRLNKLVTT